MLQGVWSDLNLAPAIDALAFRHWKLMFSNRAINPAAAAGDALVDEVTVLANAEETNFTAPVITAANMTVDATSGLGAIVNFTATALDDVDGAVPVTFTPASGTALPIGVSTITCRAVDAAQNVGTATFTVTVNANGFTPQPPPVPAGISATPGFGFVTLNWAAVPYSSSYTIYRAASSGGTFALVASGLTAPTFTDAGLVNGTPLFYKVTAVNPAGESGLSAEIPATPIPGTAGKANNTVNLDDVGSWAALTVPGPSDIALWDQTVTDANTTTIGNGVAFSGIRITNPIGDVAINAGTGGNLTLGSQGIDMSGATSDLALGAGVVLAANQTWAVGGATLTSTGALSGTGKITKTGTGMFVLSGTSSAFSGGIAVNAGTLRASGSNSVWGTGTVTLGAAGGSDPATLDFGITSSITVSNPLNIASGSGTRSIRSNMANTAGQTFSGPISGTGDLYFAAGVVTLSGSSASTFTGNLFVTGGRLRLASGSSFNTATILSVGSGASVDLNASGSSWNFAGFSDISGSGGTITNAGGTRTMNLKGGGNYAFSGNIQSNIKLVVNLTGTGSQTLSGTNCSYGGTTTVTAGTSIVNGALTSRRRSHRRHRRKTRRKRHARREHHHQRHPPTRRRPWHADFYRHAGVFRHRQTRMGTRRQLHRRRGSCQCGGGHDHFRRDDPARFQPARQRGRFQQSVLVGRANLAGPDGHQPERDFCARQFRPNDINARPASGYGTFSLQQPVAGTSLVWTPRPIIEQWRFTWFNTNASTGTAADDADPNKDGETNFLEFATGQNPNAATTTPGSLVKNGANLEFTYTRNKAAMTRWRHLHCGIQRHTRGRKLEQLRLSQAMVPGSDRWPGPDLKAIVPPGSGPKRFVRLRITKS